MKFQIKRLLQNDTAYAKELNTVFSIAFNDSASYQDKKPSDDYLVSILSDPSIIVLISLYNNSVVGGLVAYQLKKMEQARSEVYIYDLAVKEEFRRKKIASQLINELKLISKSLGAWVIFVQADKEDTPAINLYKSLGSQEEPLHFDLDL